MKNVIVHIAYQDDTAVGVLSQSFLVIFFFGTYAVYARTPKEMKHRQSFSAQLGLDFREEPGGIRMAGAVFKAAAKPISGALKVAGHSQRIHAGNCIPEHGIGIEAGLRHRFQQLGALGRIQLRKPAMIQVFECQDIGALQLPSSDALVW